MRVAALGKVDKLVALAVVGAVLLTWAFLVGFDAFHAFITEINDIGTGRYTLGKAIVATLLTVPRRGYQFFGYAALIGGLLGMGGLAGSGELTALRAAGLSKLRISASVVWSLAVLTLLVMLMGETIAPRAEQHAEAIELSAKSKDVALGRGGSVWARDGDNVVSARHGRALGAESGADSRVELQDVRVFEFGPRGRLRALSLARTALHAHGRWTLHDVRRSVFDTDSVNTTQRPSMQWQSKLDPKVLALSMIHPEYLSMRDLALNIDYMHANRQDASIYQRAYWVRAFYPLNVLVLALCALPFAFGTLRTGGLGKRLLIGIVAAISFYLFQSTVVSMASVYNFNLVLANALPSLVLAAGAWVYFRRFG